ncbi:MAG: hypothetical protein QOD50_2168, partial [Actinomycetota bacterium]|nr:hypothetical protein [Actinomycetota bacterium]
MTASGPQNETADDGGTTVPHVPLLEDVLDTPPEE